MLKISRTTGMGAPVAATKKTSTGDRTAPKPRFYPVRMGANKKGGTIAYVYRCDFPYHFDPNSMSCKYF